MNNHPQSPPEVPDQIGSQPLPGPAPDVSAAALQTENARLQEQIRQLEDVLRQDRETLAAVRAERDAYRRAAYAWALDQITDADLERYSHDEPGLSLEAFIVDLEARLNGGGNA